MTKNEWIFYIKNIVGASEKTARYHPAQIELVLERAYNQILYDYSFDETEDMNYFTKEYTAVAVSLDATTNRRYSTLPAKIVQMPRNRMSVRHINTNQGTDLQMFPMTERQWELVGSSDADTYNTRIGYMVRYPKIWYYNMPAYVATVRMVLVIPFSQYASTDEVMIPAGREQDFERMALEMSGYIQPVDLLNKNK